MQHMLTKAAQLSHDEVGTAEAGTAQGKAVAALEEHSHGTDEHSAHDKEDKDDKEDKEDKDRAHTHTKHVAVVNITEEGEIDLEQVGAGNGFSTALCAYSIETTRECPFDGRSCCIS
jgi:hypothetical protein